MLYRSFFLFPDTILSSSSRRWVHKALRVFSLSVDLKWITEGVSLSEGIIMCLNSCCETQCHTKSSLYFHTFSMLHSLYLRRKRERVRETKEHNKPLVLVQTAAWVSVGLHSVTVSKHANETLWISMTPFVLESQK